MKRLIFALAVALPLPPHAERLTQECNNKFLGPEVTLRVVSEAAQANLVAIVTNPATNPDAYARMWSPASGSAYFKDYGLNQGYYVSLPFDRVQDTDEIGRAIADDPVLHSLGVFDAYAERYGICFGELDPRDVTITEYFNVHLNHYFLSSGDEENAVIDAGGAGPGWTRTGETFKTVEAGPFCREIPPVFRFYTYGANSHFFTADPLECGSLRRTDPGWIYEGQAFGAEMPIDGACADGTTPLYRLYNNRWMYNDSNHRFVSRQDLRDKMMSLGWSDEGVAMCLIPNYLY